VRIVIAVTILVGLVHPAPADVHWDVHTGVGFEGGTITGELRPDAIAQTGTAIDVMLPGRDHGMGLDVERVLRLTPQFQEEVTCHLTWRWKRDTSHFGVGFGFRRLTFEAMDDRPAESVFGADLIRFDGNGPIASWAIGRGTTISVDLYAAWTLGIYSGMRHMTPDGDVEPTGRIYEALTTTYVGGVQTSVTWR
jgi:hypothetical protein